MQSQTCMPRLRFGRVTALVCGTLFIFLFAAVLSSPTIPTFAAPEQIRRANVIVQFDDFDIAAREITFTKKKISGLTALELTGFKVVTTTTSFGVAVCAIEGVGMPADNCFGDPEGRFWSYNYWDGSAWQPYSVGAGDSKIGDGAIEGWRWGQFGATLKDVPPILAAQKALKWLQKQQSATDGGYGSPSSTVESQLAIGANDYRAKDWRRNPTAPSLLDYQKSNANQYAKTGAAAAGKLAVAQIGSKACFPQKTKTPDDYYNASTGAYATEAGPQAWAMLGAAALGQTIPPEAVNYLKSLQQSNGGWEWSSGWGTDTNTTALALQALIAAGEANTSPAITNGLAYLASAQNTDGGFPYDPDSSFGTASDANSTAYVIQALLATGENPTSGEWTKNDNPIGFLQSLQLPNGSFEWQAGTGANLLATQQAIPALLGRPYPLRVGSFKACQ